MVLGGIMRGMFGLHDAADKLTSRLSGVKAAAVGALGVFAGAEALKGLWNLIKAGSELNKQLERTKQLGGDFASTIGTQRANDFAASDTARVITPAEAQKLTTEVGTTLGHPQEAMAMIAEAAKAAFVVSHFTGEDQDEIIKNLVRVADARGQIFTKDASGKEVVDPAKLEAEFNAAAKGLIVGGGFVTSSDLLQTARQGGPAARTETAEAFYAAGVEAAIQMGASKTGTALMSLFQQFIGGTMTKKVAEHLTDAGLLRPGDWHSGNSGGVVVAPGVASRFQAMMQDPQKFFADGAGAAKVDAFAKKEGISPMMAVFQLFGRATVERLVADFMSNAPQFARARQIFGGIDSVHSQYNELVKNDYDTNATALSASWQGLMQAFGDPGVPIAMRSCTA